MKFAGYAFALALVAGLTGFLTSPGDRSVIIDDPERAARGIVEAVKAFPVTPPPTGATSRDPEVRHP